MTAMTTTTTTTTNNNDSYPKSTAEQVAISCAETPAEESSTPAAQPSKNSKFPTSLADLHNPSSDIHTDLYKTLRALHHKTLSPIPRLRSIDTDSHFIRRLHEQTGLALIANERCGSWYIQPALKAGSAYFKSTDGHYGQWRFSTRRLNLSLLDVLGRQGGAVLVDSTRRGKGMSDALKRTVPVWVGVLNEVLFGRVSSEEGVKEGWLQTPPGAEAVGKSERSQIEARLPEWMSSFSSLGLDVDGLRERLKRPIRCVWAVNGEWDISLPYTRCTDQSLAEENVLVLASASHRVRGAEMSEGGYIQGAADDSEGWSRGLTSNLWWENRELLLHAGEHEVEALIDDIVKADQERRMRTERSVVCIEKTPHFFIGSGRRESAQGWDLVINCQGAGTDSKNVLNLGCREGKLGSKDLRDKLSLAKDSVVPIFIKATAEPRILITCSSGKDLSVGVALTLICILFDDGGNCRITPAKQNGSVSTQSQQEHTDGAIRAATIDKVVIKRRLAWITGSKPDANPSRATLQAVNSYLIDRPS